MNNFINEDSKLPDSDFEDLEYQEEKDIEDFEDYDEEYEEDYDNEHEEDIDEQEEDNQPLAMNKGFQNSPLNNISLLVSAEAGSVMISLKRLLSLKPGDILDIAELPPKVNLVINGKIIGDGYLVEFNGRLGVKIASLYTDHVAV